MIIPLCRERFSTQSAKISLWYQEYRYIEDRYIRALSHTFYCKFCWDIEYSLSYMGNINISRIDISRFHCNDQGKVLRNFKPLFLFPVRIIWHSWRFRTETQLLNHLCMNLDMPVDETHNCRAHITEETVNKICIWNHLQHIKHCKRFEPRSRFISRLSMIISVNIVLNRTVVGSDWRFGNLCGSHLQSLVSIQYMLNSTDYEINIGRV